MLVRRTRPSDAGNLGVRKWTPCHRGCRVRGRGARWCVGRGAERGSGRRPGGRVVLIQPGRSLVEFPAGRPEGEEAIEKALRRGMREEARVEVLEASALGYSVQHRTSSTVPSPWACPCPIQATNLSNSCYSRLHV